MKEQGRGGGIETTEMGQIIASAERYLALESHCFENYVTQELGVLYNCYFAMVSSNLTVPMLMWRNT